MNFFRKLEENLEEWMLIVFVVGIALVMSLHVIMRYFFNSPLTWAEEACRYMFVWITFLSIGYCIRKGVLLNVDALLSSLPKSVKTIVELFGNLLTLLLFLILFVTSISVVNKISISGQTSPALGIPMELVYGASTVGFFLGVVRYLQFLYHKYIKKDVEEKDRLETTTN